MVALLIDIALIVLAVSTIVIAVRIILGPTLPDRMVAADGATTHVIGLTILVGMKMESMIFIDIAIALAILSFFSAVIVGKYLAEGDVIDADHD